MRDCGLTSRQPVKHHYRVNEDKSPPLPNLLNRQFNPAAPNRVWCGDISFIRLQDKWCYLALVVDLYSRRIIGSTLSLESMKNPGAVAMLPSRITSLYSESLSYNRDTNWQICPVVRYSGLQFWSVTNNARPFYSTASAAFWPFVG